MKNKQFPIYYETHGDPSNPCMILIQGIGGQLIQWPDLFIEGLVKNGFYVVTFDNRDSGLSQYYDHLGSPEIMKAINAKEGGQAFDLPYTLEDMASDVTKLLDKLSIRKAHILGVSMGGMIAQVFALNYPERLLSLILIASTSGDPHLPPAKPEVMQFFFSSFSKGDEKESMDSYVESKTNLYKIYDPHYFDEEIVRALHKKLYHRAHRPDGFKRQLLAVMAAEPRGEKLKSLKIKSLVVHGRDDPAFPIEHGRYLANCLPRCQFKVIQKMGHGLSNELCEKIVNVICDFVNQD